MTQLRIDQFAPAVAVGDGVTNGLLFTRRLLRELGYRSDIYSFAIPDGLRDDVHEPQTFVAADCSLLLYHHSMGHDHGEWLLTQPCSKALVYHNITPAEFFPENSVLRRYSELGRRQLVDWRMHFRAAIGDSMLNTRELHSCGYDGATVLSLLVDTDRLQGEMHPPAFVQHLTADCRLYLSVGRLAENKRQYLMIEAFHHLLRLAAHPVDTRLLLVGGTTSEDYAGALRHYIQQLGLGNRVLLPGKCSDGELRWLYRHAHQYWCASAHEGFCMPLIEATHAGVPVVAFASSNIPDTLGEAGLLLDNSEPLEFALASHLLDTQAGLRQRVIAAGARNLQRYEREHLKRQLADWLARHLPPLIPAGSPSACNAFS